MCLPASDKGNNNGAREPATQKQLPWLNGGCVTISCITHTAAAPQKAHFFLNVKILHFGFRWRTNTVCTSVISYTHPTSCPRASVFPNSPRASSLFIPNNATQFSTTAVHMIHKTSPFTCVIMYLHLLLPGIYEKTSSSFTVLLGFDDSKWWLWWLWFNQAVFAWICTLLFQLGFPAVVSLKDQDVSHRHARFQA